MARIGIFDSGLGGLTVFKALRSTLEGEEIVYLGDTARVPYGTKSPATVVRYCRQISEFLLAREIEYLVIACNTASAYALDTLKEELPVPVMGVVEPGAKKAAAMTRTGRIGVIGTLGTIASGAYPRAINAANPAHEVFGLGCPLFVPLAEEGWLSHPVTLQVAQHYLKGLSELCGDLDTLVLGCTHYPLIKETIGDAAREIFGHHVVLVDSAEAVSEAVRDDIRSRGFPPASGAGSETFYFTDVSRFTEVASLFLGRPMEAPLLADLPPPSKP